MVEFHSMDFRNALLCLILFAILACGCSPGNQAQSLNVAAAASLTQVFQALAREYELETGIKVIASFAATGQLAQQFRNGAPYDIFAAADAQHIDDLIADGYLDGQTRIIYALGELILVKPAGLQVELDTLEDLAAEEIKRIAIANPDHAPYGIAAKQALLAIGSWRELDGKLIYAETVKQAAVMVSTGNADAGIIARSTLDPSLELVASIPSDLYQPILHVAAISREAQDPDRAQAFLAFLNSPTAMEILRESGFYIP